MSVARQGPRERAVVMTAEAMAKAIDRMAEAIVKANGAPESFVLLGILSRGRPLADRLADSIERRTGTRPRVGSLATTLYRDDLRSGKAHLHVEKGETHFDFDVDGTVVVLVDDVIFAGRTARAALDELMDYGRPTRVQLACLVDRGMRDLPIQPDFRGCEIETTRRDHVKVLLKETDGEDAVLLERAPRNEL